MMPSKTRKYELLVNLHRIQMCCFFLKFSKLFYLPQTGKEPPRNHHLVLISYSAIILCNIVAQNLPFSLFRRTLYDCSLQTHFAALMSPPALLTNFIIATVTFGQILYIRLVFRRNSVGIKMGMQAIWGSSQLLFHWLKLARPRWNFYHRRFQVLSRNCSKLTQSS